MQEQDTNNFGKHILDDVLSAQIEAEREGFDPGKIVSDLLSTLPIRARSIVADRFGLAGRPKKTLEELGKMYNITRERVRQIEANSLASFSSGKTKALLDPAEKLIHSVLYENGEIMEEERLINTLLDEERKSDANRNMLLFLLEFIPEFNKFAPSSSMKAAWSLKGVGFDHAKAAIQVMIAKFEEKKSALLESELESLLQTDEALKKVVPAGNFKALLSYLSLSKKINKNPFGQWGLASWSMIVPKGVRDKAYLVMLESKKPLHFTKITDLINKTGFDKRVAHPQTVHNELIKDSRFVLVGRGIYALKEWGYGEGTVADILVGILKETKQPLSREELIERVLKQRLVKRNTIVIGLQDKNIFEKVSGNKYILKQQSA